jgi:phosphomannomutase
MAGELGLQQSTPLRMYAAARKAMPHYYDRVDMRFEQARKNDILAKVSAANPSHIGGLKCTDIQTIDGHQFMMEDGGWLLIRFSGTEPVIRVYCETTQEDRVEAILDDGLRLAGLKKTFPTLWLWQFNEIKKSETIT